MKTYSHLTKLMKRLAAVCGGGLLLGLPAAVLANPGQPVSQANPRPGIFNEAPYNRTRPAPATRPVTPPLPEAEQAPSAQVKPLNGMVNVTLVNTTNATITYQVVGDTQPRRLAGKANVSLKTLEPPITITFQREDDGLLRVQPRVNTEGVLEVSLSETTDLGTDKNALVIEESGAVLVN